ncbi:unnamed protein product [marine sediment metagenome]|uniref:Uncharacterized protein n=1 Tax=marine sediment metagenome TaxID=412755 RepID=X1UWV8_9ZZZZ
MFLWILLGGGLGALILGWVIKAKINALFRRIQYPGKTDAEIAEIKIAEFRKLKSKEEADAWADDFTVL